MTIPPGPRARSLGRRGAWMAAALAATLLAGCGGSASSSSRSSVADYVMQVNGVERSLGVPLVAVSRVAAQFSRVPTRAGTKLVTQTPAEQHAALQTALGQLAPLRRRLAALAAPPQARHLRELLLRLVDRQVTLTGELSRLVIFLPQFSGAMGPFGSAITQLERTLAINQARGPAAVAQVYGEKSAALLRFRAVVLGIINRLRRLQPPTSSLPTYRTQIGALRAMAGTAGELATVLPSGNSVEVGRLLARFDRAASAPISLAAQRAQIRAIRAYDAELRSLNGLAEQAARERLRLNRTLR